MESGLLTSRWDALVWEISKAVKMCPNVTQTWADVVREVWAEINAGSRLKPVGGWDAIDVAEFVDSMVRRLV